MEMRLSRDFAPAAWELYESSFPFYERRLLADYQHVLSNPSFSPYLLWDGDQFVGLFYVWMWDRFCYCEYLTTLPELRGKGYGAQALKAMQEMVGNRLLILEIDPPVTDIARRRQGFYERAGLIFNNYQYLHPSYHEPCQPHQLMIMSWPRAITPEEFEAFRDKNYKNVADSKL